MRISLVCAAVAAVAFSSAGLAQPQQQQPQQPQTFPLSNVLTSIAGGSTPAGWTRNMDGTYKQSESGVLCPKQFGGYDFASIDGPDAARPNILGVCRYSDGQGRTGAIRIRRYVEGWGDNVSLVSNDKTLMGQSAPPMLMRHSSDRPNGGSRLTVTVVKNGLLVDCSVWQASHETPNRSFPLYCSTLTGG